MRMTPLGNHAFCRSLIAFRPGGEDRIGSLEVRSGAALPMHAMCSCSRTFGEIPPYTLQAVFNYLENQIYGFKLDMFRAPASHTFSFTRVSSGFSSNLLC